MTISKPHVSGDLPRLDKGEHFVQAAVALAKEHPEKVSKLFRKACKRVGEKDIYDICHSLLNNPDWVSLPILVDTALNACRSNSDVYRKEVSALLLHCYIQWDEMDTTPYVDLFIERHDLLTRMDLCSSPRYRWGVGEFILQYIRMDDILARKNDDETTRDIIRDKSCRFLQYLVSRGLDIERKGQIDRFGKTTTYNGLLERACRDHDVNPPNTVAIDAVLMCGANWKRIIENDSLGEGSRKYLEHHPLVIKQQLERVARSAKDNQPQGRPRM